jgi:hypothetical protein
MLGLIYSLNSNYQIIFSVLMKLIFLLVIDLFWFNLNKESIFRILYLHFFKILYYYNLFHHDFFRLLAQNVFYFEFFSLLYFLIKFINFLSNLNLFISGYYV